MRASPGIWQAHLTPDKRSFSGTAISLPSLVQTSLLQREFSLVFIRHALLPWSSVIFILTAINICYKFTWLSLRALTSHSILSSAILSSCVSVMCRWLVAWLLFLVGKEVFSLQLWPTKLVYSTYNTYWIGGWLGFTLWTFEVEIHFQDHIML